MTDSKYDMKMLKSDISYLKKGTDEIKLCLYGDRTNPKSEGLVDIVRRNTNFRKRITKLFAITWGAIAIPIGQFFYNLFKTN